jgi:hypothetical protein
VRRVLAIGSVALAGVVAIGVTAWLVRDGDRPYARLRQSTVQEIPGTLGYALEPPPDGLRPALSPAAVRERWPAGDGEVHVSLATVRDTFEDRSLGSGWVLVARGVCLRNAKGELVSDARGSDPIDLQCTDATLWILAVDPATADPLLALTGFDDTGTWAPEVAG